MEDFIHVAVGGGGCLLRTAAVLTRAQAGRVPVPPVMFCVRLFVMVVALRRLVEQFGKGCDVRLHPLREPLLDLLQQPTVAVGIVERRIRGVGTAFGISTRERATRCRCESRRQAHRRRRETPRLPRRRASGARFGLRQYRTPPGAGDRISSGSHA